jgi:hypothetical protein
MNTLTSLVALLAAMSMAVERVVEILKNLIPFLKNTQAGYWENVRFSSLHVLAALVGTVIAWQTQPTIAGLFPSLSTGKLGWMSTVVLGLMASGGSAFWNHALDLIQASKVKAEAGAASALAATPSSASN